MKKATIRKCFLRQPIHYVILDLSPPMDLITCENFCQSLRNVMLLVSSMRGTLRFPAIGVGTKCQCVFPIQTTRGNFPGFHSALQEMLSAFQNIKSGFDWKESFQVAIKQHQGYVQGLMHREDICTQLEIAVFSKLPLQELTEQLEKDLTKIDVTNLKKVCAVGVLEHSRNTDMVATQNSEKILSSSSDASCLGIVDQLELLNDKYAFDNFFKGWLHDCSIDSENVHLILPGVKSTEPTVIKCDMKEALLNPVQLPFVQQFYLNTDQSFWPQLVASPLKLPGICESILYGMPFLLYPTCCWKIEWSEIEENRQMFFSLCDQLKEKEEVLVVKLIPEPNNSALESILNVEGHFVLFPCSNNYFLIKSIANSEILLPNTSFQTDKDVCSEEISTYVTRSLEKLGNSALYNPLNFDSQIFQCLFNSQTRNKFFNQRTTVTTRPGLDNKNKNRILSNQYNFCKASDMIQSQGLADSNSGFPTQL